MCFALEDEKMCFEIPTNTDILSKTDISAKGRKIALIREDASEVQNLKYRQIPTILFLNAPGADLI